MKKLIVLFGTVVVLGFGATTQAQSVCRPIGDNSFVGPDEEIVGNQICRKTPPSAPVQPAAQPAPVPPAQPTAPVLAAQPPAKHDKPRVFISGDGNVSATGVRLTPNVSTGSAYKHDQTIELAKDFAKFCPQADATVKEDGTDYAVKLNHEMDNRNQILVTTAAGKILMTDGHHAFKVRTVADEVKEACTAIGADWAGKNIK